MCCKSIPRHIFFHQTPNWINLLDVLLLSPAVAPKQITLPASSESYHPICHCLLILPIVTAVNIIINCMGDDCEHLCGGCSILHTLLEFRPPLAP